MPRVPLKQAPEMTTCDVCGNRLRIPPGVYYRGMRMHKGEAMRMRNIDRDNEVHAPWLNEIEQELNTILTPPSGSSP
jgi:hypothetical protein